MPIYEYECLRCGDCKEVLTKWSDVDIIICDKCSNTMTRILSIASFVLKGEGFYINDYKRTKGKPPCQ